MIKYITLGSNDIEASRAFYSALLAEIGQAELFDNGRLYFYGTGMDKPMLAIGGPYDENAATVGNGVMVTIDAGDNETVDKLYAKAIALGAADEGAPGERLPIFYGAYVRDPDGNKLCFCRMG